MSSERAFKERDEMLLRGDGDLFEPEQEPPDSDHCVHCGSPYDGGHRCTACQNGDPLGTGEFDPETGDQ